MRGYGKYIRRIGSGPSTAVFAGAKIEGPGCYGREDADGREFAN
jgi:hypothetical protein